MPRPTPIRTRTRRSGLTPATFCAALALAACRRTGTASEEVRPAVESASNANAEPEPVSELADAPATSEEPALIVAELDPATPNALGPDPEGGTVLEIAGRPAFLALPRGEPPRPAVLLVREAGRIGPVARELARRIADEGFAALAMDITSPPPDGGLERSRARALVELDAALRFLHEDGRVRAPRTVAIGYGAQGGIVLELALNEPELVALALVQTPLITDPERLLPLRASVLGLFGSRDATVPPDRVADFVDELKTTGKSVEVRMYDAGHGFADPRSPNYDPATARTAWEELRAFLGRILR